MTRPALSRGFIRFGVSVCRVSVIDKSPPAERVRALASGLRADLLVVAGVVVFVAILADR